VSFSDAEIGLAGFGIVAPEYGWDGTIIKHRCHGKIGYAGPTDLVFGLKIRHSLREKYYDLITALGLISMKEAIRQGAKDVLIVAPIRSRRLWALMSCRIDGMRKQSP